MSKQYSAVIIGDINIDIITPPFDPQVLIEGETSCVLDSFTLSLGGNAINAAATIASLGGDHLFIGGLGTDAISEWIKKRCEELGINTKFSVLKDKTAGITLALTFTGGKRQFVATLGTNKLIKMDDLDLSIIENSSLPIHLHRAGFWYTLHLKGNPTIEIFRKVLEKGGETSLDVGWDPEGFTEENRKILYETLKYTKYFFANEKEIKKIAAKEDVEEAYRELLSIEGIKDRVLVVHRGEKGSLIITPTQRLEIKAAKVKKIENPTGSGDVYNGAFIYGICKGWDYKECAEFAGKIAAIHIEDRKKIYPTLKDLEAFTKERE